MSFSLINRINNEELKISIENIKIKAKNIHNNPFLYTFTDHGIEHSKRMLTCLNKLLESCKQENLLNEYECYVLIAAVYLHDIGIQETKEELLQKFARQYNLIFDRSTDKEIFIRNNHHLISSFLIKEDINNNEKILAYDGDPELGRYIALVVEAHGIDFSNDNKNYKQYIYQDLYVRVDLLSVLLCLADCFDCDKRRIDSQKFRYTELPKISRLHWLKHLYVRGINFNNNIITISYSFPKIQPHEKNIYEAFFVKETEFWINDIKNKYLPLLNATGLLFELNREFDYVDYLQNVDHDDYCYIEESVFDDTIKSQKNISYTKVSIGILVHNGCVLMVQRNHPEKDMSRDSKFVLEWQFPAGIVKNGDNPEDAIIREVIEETGICCSINKMLGRRIHPNTKTLCYYYVLNYESGKILNGDINENRIVSWIPIKECHTKITSDIYNKVSVFLKEEKTDEK